MTPEIMASLLAEELPVPPKCGRGEKNARTREWLAFVGAAGVEEMSAARFSYEITSEFQRDFVEADDTSVTRREGEQTECISPAPRILRPIGASCACGASMPLDALQCGSCARRSFARAA